MTVQEYVNKFEHLARYYSQAITEELRCLKFERGLKHELKKVVTPLRERRFPGQKCWASGEGPWPSY